MTRVATIGFVVLCGGSLGLLGCGDGEEDYHPHPGATGGHAGTGGSSAGSGGSTGGHSGTGGGEPGGEAGASTGGSVAEAGEGGVAGLVGAAGESGAAGAIPVAGSAGEGVTAGAGGVEPTAGAGPEGGAGAAAAGAGGAAGSAGIGPEGGGGASATGGGSTGGSAGAGATGGDTSGGNAGAGPGGDAGAATGGSGIAGAAGAGTGGATGGTSGGGGQAGNAGAAGAGGSTAPRCAISSPVFTPTHPALNGVPVADEGDRVSSLGSPYEARVQVQTSIEDGQAVELVVDSGVPIYTVAGSGVATFAGVTFEPDGDHAVQAGCRARSGEVILSELVTFPVDTAPPDVTVLKVTQAGPSDLEDADHFGPDDDADSEREGLQIRLCGATDATDAIDLNPVRDNFAAYLLPGPSLLGSAPVTSGAGNGACVDVDCPGSGPFDVVLALADAAGNPAAVTVNNITCASDNPLVMLVDPISDEPGFANPLLVADDTQPSQTGAQYDVVACTNAPVGSGATLSIGLLGGALAQIAMTTVEADSVGGTCQTSQLNRAVFTDATLTPSSEDGTTYELTDPTRLEVTITDLNLGVGTASAQVWVDMRAPALVLRTSGICDAFIPSAVAVTRDLTFGTPLASAAHPVTVVVTEDGNDETFFGTVYDALGASADVNVEFQLGVNTLTASVAEPSGNIGVLSGACTVTVGPNPPPTVTWESPVEGMPLIAAVELPDTPPGGALEDADPGSGGWQGDLSVSTSLSGDDTDGVTVTFTATSADGSVVTELGTIPLGSDGTATLADVDVPEGMDLRLRAETSPGASTSGSSTIVVDVDSIPPTNPSDLVASVVPALRRQTTFDLAWTAGSGATGYDVRVYGEEFILANGEEITAENFYGGDQIAFNGQPQPGGSDESLNVAGLYVENDYLFAVRAVDDVGNRSEVLATPAVTRENLDYVDLSAPTPGRGFGWAFDGSGDVNGDGFTDLLVGTKTGANVYLYFGGENGLNATPITFVGDGDGFGSAVAIVGDIGSDPSTTDDDGIDDIVIGSHFGGPVGDGAVYVFYGRTSWTAPAPAPAPAPTPIDYGSYDVMVTVDGGEPPGDPYYFYSEFGYSIARLGNFDGQGTNDFAVGAPYYNWDDGSATSQGQVVVVLGKDRAPGAVVTLSETTFGAEGIRIDGEASVSGSFGYSVAGIGVRPGSDNTVLVASAAYATVGGNAAAGRVYAITGVTGVDEIAISGQPMLSGTIASERVGQVLSPAGDLGPGGTAAIGLPLPFSAAPGRAEIRSGTQEGGLFSWYVRLRPEETTGSGRFGRTMIGGVVPGKGTPVSIVGSALSDVIVPTLGTDPQVLYLVDGAEIIQRSNEEVDITTIAAAKVILPVTVVGFSRQVTVLTDVNQDGYGDFAIGEASMTTDVDGRLRAYW